ncbi:tRNA (guanine-N(7)-)-methyltransferase non-catalytic subunit wuho [Megachile rotundata]|uniref:tRNA (guanine-N(7)-)-methyltransferase non-catalytic subunit wuho n=1 Tax=Megachile rotundata TaxID=143995 RepID=UPI003FD27670
MSFCIYDSDVILCNNEEIIVYNIENNAETVIHLPELQADKKVDVHNNRKSQKLVLNKILPRAASKVQFTPSNDIIVADKAGDVYLFSNKEFANGILLLGHLSMLLDVLITEDERYIITTDRDEKIRVSMFPNSYNIVSYCLGHRKFVTNIAELPHDKSVLVSCGGDGCHLEEVIETLPVKHLRLSLISTTSSLALLSFYNNPLLLVFIINGTMMSNFEVNYLQSIVTDNEPLECYISKQNLWLLNDSGFKIYEFKDNTFVLNNEINYKMNQLNNFWKMLKKDTIQQNLFSILYKRKYDNVQEYLQRKKTRLGSISE